MAEKLVLAVKPRSGFDYPQGAEAGKIELLPGQKLEVRYIVDGETVGGYEFPAPADLGDRRCVGVYNRVTAQPEGSTKQDEQAGVFSKKK